MAHLPCSSIQERTFAPSPRRRLSGVGLTVEWPQGMSGPGQLLEKPMKRAMDRPVAVPCAPLLVPHPPPSAAGADVREQTGEIGFPVPPAPTEGRRRPSRLTMRQANAAQEASEQEQGRVLRPSPTASSASTMHLHRPGSAASSSSTPAAQVSFPAPLHLRRSTEAAGHPSEPWVVPGEPFGLPLQLQQEVRREIVGLAAQEVDLRDGQSVTLWAYDLKGNSAEPLAASPADDGSFEVLPTECIVERQGESDGLPIRFGECFRLRTPSSGSRRLHLAHSSSAGSGSSGLTWVAAESADRGASISSALSCTRFAAHGRELGRPVRLGRCVQILPVASPPPSSDSSDDEDESSSDSDGNPPLRTAAKEEPQQTQIPSPEAQLAGRAPLLSRFADVRPTFTAAFLPVTKMLQ
mmetsp:Transcript_51519/g.122510  ORF Transcript_51519/g.122510 Transcript_51519/m.122510 type:complete len:409 (+) Transcript_51519:116-1342(+)